MRYVLMIMIMALCVNCMAKDNIWPLWAKGPYFSWQGDTALVVSQYSKDSLFVWKTLYIADDLKHRAFNIGVLGYSPYCATQDSTIKDSGEAVIELGSLNGEFKSYYKEYVSLDALCREVGWYFTEKIILSAHDIRAHCPGQWEACESVLKEEFKLVTEYDEATDTWTERYETNVEEFPGLRVEKQASGFKTQIFAPGEHKFYSARGKNFPDVTFYDDSTGETTKVPYHETYGLVWFKQ